MNFQQICRLLGISEEKGIQELVSTGTVTEQDARRMVKSGDDAGLHRFAMRHKDRVRGNEQLMNQARFMGAKIPKNF